MNRKAIVNQVQAIILEHAKPVRVWLYGSEAIGEATKVSDIDIAYLDQERGQEKDQESDQGDSFEIYSTLSDIKEAVEKLNTLVSIDVSLLNTCSERFVNRVKTTGKVLYSSSKPLRAEDGVHNFEKSLNRLNETLGQKDFFETQKMADVYTDVIIKRFESTFEMSWKAIKRVLAMIGLDDNKSPRQCFKIAFAQGFIEDEDIWLNMIEMRNLSAHTCDSDEIAQIVFKIESYATAFNNLFIKLNEQFTT